MTELELEEQLKSQVIEALSLQDIVSPDFDADTPLFRGELGLDSIDAIELIVLLEKRYGVKIKSLQERDRFDSVRKMAKLIMVND